MRISVTGYLPGEHLKPHVHDVPYISVVLQGSYTELSGATPRLCSPSTILLHCAGEEHADYFHADAARCLNIEFLNGELPPTGSGDYSTLDTIDGVLALLDADDLTLHGAVADLASSLRSAHAVRTRAAWAKTLVRDARALVEENVRQTNPVAQTAHRLGVHRTHLWREFRRTYGESLRSAAASAKVRKAASLLVATEVSLSHIAAECGYFDQAHFTRQFKSRVGLTPATFRKRFPSPLSRDKRTIPPR